MLARRQLLSSAARAGAHDEGSRTTGLPVSLACRVLGMKRAYPSGTDPSGPCARRPFLTHPGSSASAPASAASGGASAQNGGAPPLLAEADMRMAHAFDVDARAASKRNTLVTLRRALPIPPNAQEVLTHLRRAAEERAPGVTLRVAGGWVRDLLRQLPEYRPVPTPAAQPSLTPPSPGVPSPQSGHASPVGDASPGLASAGGFVRTGRSGGSAPLVPTWEQLAALEAVLALRRPVASPPPSTPSSSSSSSSALAHAPASAVGSGVSESSGGTGPGAGKPSLGDIDIAVDTMTGIAFAREVEAYAAARGLIARFAEVSTDASNSRHLSAARGSMQGEQIDMLHLRTEAYAADSHRVPTVVGFGTPAEDAVRRDFTVNAMFYNIHSGEVEDFNSGLGLEDLRRGHLRTPLPPRAIFRDDPLRVLRAARFAGRFAFSLAPEMIPAARCPSVREAMRSKVRAERIGVEVTKMLEDSGMQLSYSLGLLRILRVLDVALPLYPHCIPMLTARESGLYNPALASRVSLALRTARSALMSRMSKVAEGAPESRRQRTREQHEAFSYLKRMREAAARDAIIAFIEGEGSSTSSSVETSSSEATSSSAWSPEDLRQIADDEWAAAAGAALAREVAEALQWDAHPALFERSALAMAAVQRWLVVRKAELDAAAAAGKELAAAAGEAAAVAAREGAEESAVGWPDWSSSAQGSLCLASALLPVISPDPTAYVTADPSTGPGALLSNSALPALSRSWLQAALRYPPVVSPTAAYLPPIPSKYVPESEIDAVVAERGAEAGAEAGEEAETDAPVNADDAAGAAGQATAGSSRGPSTRAESVASATSPLKVRPVVLELDGSPTHPREVYAVLMSLTPPHPYCWWKSGSLLAETVAIDAARGKLATTAAAAAATAAAAAKTTSTEATQEPSGPSDVALFAASEALRCQYAAAAVRRAFPPFLSVRTPTDPSALTLATQDLVKWGVKLPGVRANEAEMLLYRSRWLAASVAEWRAAAANTSSRVGLGVVPLGVAGATGGGTTGGGTTGTTGGGGAAAGTGPDLWTWIDGYTTELRSLSRGEARDRLAQGIHQSLISNSGDGSKRPSSSAGVSSPQILRVTPFWPVPLMAAAALVRTTPRPLLVPMLMLAELRAHYGQATTLASASTSSSTSSSRVELSDAETDLRDRALWQTIAADSTRVPHVSEDHLRLAALIERAGLRRVGTDRAILNGQQIADLARRVLRPHGVAGPDHEVNSLLGGLVDSMSLLEAVAPQLAAEDLSALLVGWLGECKAASAR